MNRYWTSIAIRPIPTHTSICFASSFSNVSFIHSRDLGPEPIIRPHARAWQDIRYHSGYYVMYRQLLWTHTFMYFDSPFLFPHCVFDPENWKVGGNHRRVMHCPTRTLVLRVEIGGVITGLFACSAGTPTVDMKSAKFTMYHMFTSRPTTELQMQVQLPSLAIGAWPLFPVPNHAYVWWAWLKLLRLYSDWSPVCNWFT